MIDWATDALDEVRHGEWNQLRGANNTDKAKTVKGMRWLLLRNWENLRGAQRAVISFISMIMLDRAGIAPNLPWKQAS